MRERGAGSEIEERGGRERGAGRERERGAGSEREERGGRERSGE